MPRGYGGFDKDNTLAYADYVESDDERKLRKEREAEYKRQTERGKSVVRREQLAQIVRKRQLAVKKEEEQVTEDDIEYIHGGAQFDLLQRRKCCDERFVDEALEDGRGQLTFIIKALFPIMIGYGGSTVYGIFMIYNRRLRAYFYMDSPTYALISVGCWVGLNLFGRLIRHFVIMFPIVILRALAIANLLAASQLYSEYFVWEIVFRDPTVVKAETVVQLEERLRNAHPFPESWLDLSNDTTKNDLERRTEFTMAFFGALLGFSLFLPLFCVIIGLLICSPRTNLTPHQVTGRWMTRTAAIAAVVPPVVMFFVNDNLHFLPGPKSYNFVQTYPIGLLSIIFAVLSSAVWGRLFAGKTCFNVHKDDYLYMGFMFTI